MAGIQGPEQPAPEYVQRMGEGIELLCCYVYHGQKRMQKGSPRESRVKNNTK